MQFPHFSRTILPLALIAAFTGCKKDFDTPVERTLPEGAVVTIAQLKAMFTNAPVHFTSNMSVYGTIIADENDGNFYKNVYMQDSTGGICLRLLTSGGLYIGDRMRVYLPGTVLSPYSNLMQLDSVNVDNNVVKQSTLNHVEPRHLTITQLNAILSAGNVHDTLQSTLVQLDSVEFVTTEACGGSPWSDAVGQTTVNRTLEDCSGNQIIVRTSGYANYASLPLPSGKGSIVCVAALFGTTPQLYVRTLPEVHLTAARCPGQECPFFSKTFDDANPTSGGWTQWSDTTIFWTTNTIGAFSGPYGQIKNYVGGVNIPCETWLISPSIDLTTTTAPQLSFYTGCNYTGSVLQVLASTDYVSGDPHAATWTVLPAAFSPGTWTWTSSGALDLMPYHTANMHFAYKYTGTNADGKTWELDNIKILDP